MTFNQLVETLSEYGSTEPRSEACLILEELFAAEPYALVLIGDRDYDSPQLQSLLEKRKARIPLQYILGKWEFMGKKFYVSPACLIPRSDTEILVEKAIEIVWNRTRGRVNYLKSTDYGIQGALCRADESECEASSEYQVADLCTGSGCIGLSLLMYSHIDSMTLMDISDDALDMARKNAEYHELTPMCEFICGDITKDMPKKQFDMIVSNPPYIPTADIGNLSPEVRHEPALALDGGVDGFDIIRFLTSEGLSYLKENGVMLIEFGYDQKNGMELILGEKQTQGLISSYEILYDYGGNPRVAVIVK